RAFAGRRRAPRAGRRRRVAPVGSAVVHRELVPGLEEVQGHGLSHDPHADEAYVHGGKLYSIRRRRSTSRGVRRAAAGRRGRRQEGWSALPLSGGVQRLRDVPFRRGLEDPLEAVQGEAPAGGAGRRGLEETAAEGSGGDAEEDAGQGGSGDDGGLEHRPEARAIPESRAVPESSRRAEANPPRLERGGVWERAGVEGGKDWFFHRGLSASRSHR